MLVKLQLCYVCKAQLGRLEARNQTDKWPQKAITRLLWELREKHALGSAAACYTVSPEIHLVMAGSTHSQQTVSRHLRMSACHGSTYTVRNLTLFALKSTPTLAVA